MITFKSIRWKNLLSTGNDFTHIELDKTSTTLIVGDNGAGKSTILDAITFALFNKPFRAVNKNQLINSINKKQTVVELEFETKGQHYFIRRGIKPNLFEICKNDKPINQEASAKDQQDFLEKSILGFNQKSFTQIVMLGSSSFVPFMQLKTQDRRAVIEDLLDLHVFSEMSALLRARNSELKTVLVEVKNDLQVANAKVDGFEQLVQQSNQNQQRIIESIEQQIEDIRTESVAKATHVKEQDKEIQDLAKKCVKLGDVQDEMYDIKSTISSTKKDLEKIEKEAKFFDDSDDCPLCKQHIAHDHKLSLEQNLEATANTLKEELRDLDAKRHELEQLLHALQHIDSQKRDLERVQAQTKGELKTNLSQIRSLEQRLSDAEEPTTQSSEYQKQLDEAKSLVDDLEATYQEKVNLRSIYTTAGDILKDNGIKAKIIEKYVPLMNQLINKYLADMDFFVEFELDETFDETIRSRYRDDFTYASFSEGEKMRIDMSLLLCWRKIATLKNSVKTNLLLLDEVFDSSLDNQGIDDVMKLLKTVDSNVFLISHKGDALIDKFDRVLKFEKPQNFSVLSDETIG